MNSLIAKQVFTALAKSLFYSSVQRCDLGSHCMLLFISSSGIAACTFKGTILRFNSSKWADMLKELEGKTIAIGTKRIKVDSIEQLMIDLELQGFLKKMLPIRLPNSI